MTNNEFNSLEIELIKQCIVKGIELNKINDLLEENRPEGTRKRGLWRLRSMINNIKIEYKQQEIIKKIRLKKNMS